MTISKSKPYSLGVGSLFYDNMGQSPSPARGQPAPVSGDGAASVALHLPGLLLALNWWWLEEIFF